MEGELTIQYLTGITSLEYNYKLIGEKQFQGKDCQPGRNSQPSNPELLLKSPLTKNRKKVTTNLLGWECTMAKAAVILPMSFYQSQNQCQSLLRIISALTIKAN